MKILIADQSPLSLARVRRQIIAALGGADILEAMTLTDTYHLAEHHIPDVLVIAQDLTRYAEFELVVSLLNIMDISCFVLHKDITVAAPNPTFRQIIDIPAYAVGEQICKAAKTTKRQSVKEHDAPTDRARQAEYHRNRLILVGASTGGIDALLNLTQHFTQDCPPLLIVQHTGGAFARSLIRLLNGASPASVIAAEDGMPVAAGYIYLASDDRAHLTLAPSREARIRLDHGPPMMGHRPSIDALFTSALPHAARISAALLTGMGKDGAAGLTQLRRAGAYTVGQDKKTSVVYGMPRVAMEMGGVSEQLPLAQIGPALLKSCQMRQPT